MKDDKLHKGWSPAELLHALQHCSMSAAVSMLPHKSQLSQPKQVLVLNNLLYKMLSAAVCDQHLACTELPTAVPWLASPMAAHRMQQPNCSSLLGSPPFMPGLQHECVQHLLCAANGQLLAAPHLQVAASCLHACKMLLAACC
jgi:hypothetical protein